MLDFYSTNGGRRFIDGTIPELVRQIARLADELNALRLSREQGLVPSLVIPKKPDPPKADVIRETDCCPR